MAGDRLRAELELLATRDSLTHTFTRRYMGEACAAELERSNRTGKPAAMLMMDLDHFKSVNDTHGHHAGDQVLLAFAARVQGLLRKHDLLGRFGGEEFVLLLPDSTLDVAYQVAERIRNASIPDDQAVGCTVSIGVTAYRGPDDNFDEMLIRADGALYQAKNTGRNRTVVN